MTYIELQIFAGMVLLTLLGATIYDVVVGLGKKNGLMNIFKSLNFIAYIVCILYGYLSLSKYIATFFNLNH